MPLTTGSVWPIAAYGGAGGTSAAPQFVLPMDASETINPGDVLVATTTTRDLSVNNNPTGGTNPIVGVAALTGAAQKTTTATVDRSASQIAFWPAFTNMLFTGNIVGGADTDYPGLYATSLQFLYGTIACTAPTPDIAAINQADATTGVAYTLFYVRQKSGATGPESGVGVTNPRVAFVFPSTVTVWGAGIVVA